MKQLWKKNVMWPTCRVMLWYCKTPFCEAAPPLFRLDGNSFLLLSSKQVNKSAICPPPPFTVLAKNSKQINVCRACLRMSELLKTCQSLSKLVKACQSLNSLSEPVKSCHSFHSNSKSICRAASVLWGRGGRGARTVQVCLMALFRESFWSISRDLQNEVQKC